MALLGRAITVIGAAMILAPPVGAVAGFLGQELPYVLEYAPSFILGGLTVFIIGVGLQQFGR